MNKIIRNMKFMALAMVAVVAQACQNTDNEVVMSRSMRTITVHTAATRTTIDFEGSDVSHLVWVEGDQVAYVTDAAGDLFRKAEVKSNAFTAEIPKGATQLYVLYPAGENEGKSLAEARAAIEANPIQVAGEGFRGEQLPMMATTAVPSGNNVEVVYECMASVLRFTVSGAEHETETLQSLRISAAENLVGEFSLDVTNNTVNFEGSATETTVSYEGEGEAVLLTDSHDIFVVVPSAVYSDVEVTVKTDLKEYYWVDGTMDLTHPERRLYRVALDLNQSSDAPVPEVPIFKPVLSIDEVTDKGEYLIAVMLNGKYYVTNNVPTDTSNYYYLTAVEVDFNEEGIIANEETMNYTWTITHKEDGYEFYSPHMSKQGEQGVLLIAQGGSGSSLSQEDGEGKAWFVTPSTADGYSAEQQPRRCWDIVPDGTGYTTLYNQYDRNDGMGPICYKYSTSHEYFTLCYEDAANKAEIMLMKWTLE